MPWLNSCLLEGRKDVTSFAPKDGDRPAGKTDANNVGNAPGRKLSRRAGAGGIQLGRTWRFFGLLGLHGMPRAVKRAMVSQDPE